MGDFFTFLERSTKKGLPTRIKEHGMHDIMGQQDKWQNSVEKTIRVSHQIYSLSDDCTALCTLFGASKCIFFGVPMGLGILGFLLHLFGNTASLIGGIIHIMVATWILVSYLLWVYGILGFHLSPETLHSSRVMMKYSSQHGCYGVYVRILRYRPNFKDERKSIAAVHPMEGSYIRHQSMTPSARASTAHEVTAHTRQAPGNPSTAVAHTSKANTTHVSSAPQTLSSQRHKQQLSSPDNKNFITKAWT